VKVYAGASRGTCARDHPLGLAERRAALFRPPQSPPTANLTTLEHSDLDRRHGRQISTLAATNTTQNLLSPPTQPSKWRTTAASLSTCKRPPEICSDSRESPLRLENSPMEDRRVYKLTWFSSAQVRPPQVQRDQPHHQGQGPRLCPDQHRQG
jgi:hypothetical protein